MANETTYTTMTDGFTIAAAVANEQILEALHDLDHIDALTRKVDLSGIPSKSHDIGIWPRLASASVGEGVDLAASQVNSTKATVTASEKGLMIVPTDALNLSSLAQIMDFAREAAAAVREQQMGDVCALAAGFSGAISNTGVNVTETNVIDTIAGLANARHIGVTLRGAMYPQVWLDYVKSVGSVFTPATGPGAAGPRAAMAEFALMAGGFQRDVFGAEWYVTTAVQTANSGADSACFLVNPLRAIARGVKYESRVEVQRDASLRATEIVVTAFDGVVEIEDSAGYGLIIDR